MSLNVFHSGDASDDFFSERVMVTAGLRLRKDRPAAIVHDVVPYVEELPKDHPTFTMISARTETRKYGGSEVVIIKYVLMDGSETLVKAATDSSLAKYMISVDIEVGSTIVVLDYYMVWMEGSHPLEWRSKTYGSEEDDLEAATNGIGDAGQNTVSKIQLLFVQICS